MTQASPATITTTATSTSLLAELGEPQNRVVWQEFVDRYRPIIAGYARRLSLNQEDSEDAAQETLLAFAESYRAGRYDRERGRLRVWLFAIARNQIMKVLRSRRGAPTGMNEQDVDASNTPSGVDELDERWEQEWRQGILRACLHELRAQLSAQTIQAFELHAWKGWPAKRVADELSMSENAVFLAKHHVLRRIREMIPQMELVF